MMPQPDSDAVFRHARLVAPQPVAVGRVERGRIHGRRLWPMGESRDPEPVEIAMSSGLHEVRAPYLAVGDRALLLTPSLIWDVIPARESYGLLFLDKVGEERLHYKKSWLSAVGIANLTRNRS